MAPGRRAKPVLDLTDWIVRTDTYPVAYGGFSDVWSCQLRLRHLPPAMVAVKVVRPNDTANEEAYQAVERELKVWAPLKHPNVLPLYGIVRGFGPLLGFVCPWADNGTLSDYLGKFETQLDLKKRMALLRDIAAGLQYLHCHDTVHGDISGSNVLIMRDGRACLSDFGLSTLLEQVSDTSVSLPGNIRWVAPELLSDCGGPRSKLVRQRADIYSFGSIMLQILTGKPPFHWIQRPAQIVIMVSSGFQPPRELGWDGKPIPDVLWRFIEACWASPSERPSCKDIVAFTVARDDLFACQHAAHAQ